MLPQHRSPAIRLRVPDLEIVFTDGLQGEVHSVNVLKQVVKVIISDTNGDREAKDYPASELLFKARKHYEKAATPDELKELRELEALERKDSKNHLDD